MDKDKYEQLLELIERRYQEGVRDGENAALGKLVTKLETTYPHDRKARRQRRPETRPRLKNPAESLAAPVGEAITALARSHPNGVDPAAIARLVEDGDLRQVRLALRHLTLAGAVQRVARGRYLPAATSAPAPLAAE